jgi:hypothetical protein
MRSGEDEIRSSRLARAKDDERESRRGDIRRRCEVVHQRKVVHSKTKHAVKGAGQGDGLRKSPEKAGRQFCFAT